MSVKVKQRTIRLQTAYQSCVQKKISSDLLFDRLIFPYKSEIRDDSKIELVGFSYESVALEMLFEANIGLSHRNGGQSQQLNWFDIDVRGLTTL